MGHLRLRRLGDHLRERGTAREDRGDQRQVPNLRTIIVIDPPAGDSPLQAITLEEVRARGRGRAATSSMRAAQP